MEEREPPSWLHRLAWLVPPAAGALAAVTTGILIAVSSLVLLSVVLGPVSWAWASTGKGFHPEMFAQFSSSVAAAVLVAYVPSILLAALLADGVTFSALSGFLDGDGRAAGLSAVLTMTPAALLLGVGMWSVLSLLALQTTVGASSYGRRLPGDRNGLTYVGLAIFAFTVTSLAVIAWLVSLVLRPVVTSRLKAR